jgi:hypothetical protein
LSRNCGERLPAQLQQLGFSLLGWGRVLALAATLVLSERTVESHVRSILAKTGLKSRTEITRWWLQQRQP